MNCIYCGSSNTKVVDSRKFHDAVDRRRECLSCGKRFTTIEKPLSATNTREYAPIGRPPKKKEDTI